MEILYGVHAVEEALRAGRRRFDHVLLARERLEAHQAARLQRLAAECRAAGVRVLEQPREQLTQLAGTAAHQGVVALVRPQEFLTIEDLFAAPPAPRPAPSPAPPACSSPSTASKTRRTSARSSA